MSIPNENGPLFLLSLGKDARYLQEADRLQNTDGGGIRGVSELVVLDRIMRRLKDKEDLDEVPRPCDYFDLMAGTSTGG